MEDVHSTVHWRSTVRNKAIHTIWAHDTHETLVSKLRDDMEADHKAFQYCCETHWLSRAKVHHRISNLREKVKHFLSHSNDNDNKTLFSIEGFIQILAC
jgi:hypothetical protein